MKPGVPICPCRRSALKMSSAATALMVLCPLTGCLNRPLAPEKMTEGLVWQIDNETLELQGSWDRIGARTLLIQWCAVDNISFVAGGPWPQAKRLPDWETIARQPWAENVILGLAGRSDENAARADVAGLVAVSEQLARLPTPLNVTGYYFPVEIDSSWQAAMQLGPLLARLPRPLWLSVYDSANVGAETLATWLGRWLPADIGIFFQDGVGVHARNAAVARKHADVLIRRFGRSRVRVIAEAFRPKEGGGFRAATAEELRTQLETYDNLPVYLFDGPHYVSENLVNQLALHR
ncbi:MAG: hypothetical protein JWR68_715 [Polaromonas sp.]|nr:hypothetical protein [Polaromonas sp.]